MNEIAMMVSGKAKSGKREELHALFERLLAPAARANDTQRFVAFCLDQADPDRFFLFEIYTSAAAMQQNAQNPVFAEYMQASMPLLSGQPEMAMGSLGFLMAK